MSETPTAAVDVKELIQHVCYRAIHHAAFDTSDEMMEAVEPLLDMYVAAELRRIADAEAEETYIEIHDLVNMLRARADELDPPAKET